MGQATCPQADSRWTAHGCCDEKILKARAPILQVFPNQRGVVNGAELQVLVVGENKKDIRLPLRTRFTRRTDRLR